MCQNPQKSLGFVFGVASSWPECQPTEEALAFPAPVPIKSAIFEGLAEPFLATRVFTRRISPSFPTGEQSATFVGIDGIAGAAFVEPLRNRVFRSEIGRSRFANDAGRGQPVALPGKASINGPF